MEGYPIDLDALVGPFKLRARDPIDIELSMTDGDDNPIDLNGFGGSWFAQLRYKPRGDAVADFDVDTTTGLDGDGKLLYIVISLSADQSAELTMTSPPDACQAAPYVFDVEAQGGTHSPFGVWKGSIQTEVAITRG